MHMIHVSRSFMIAAFWAAGAGLPVSFPARAQDTLVSGRLLLSEGHEVPPCRRLQLRTESGNDMWFHLSDGGADNSIIAVALTALAGNKRVTIAYRPSLFSGCGTEPRVLYISILAD